jgi:hypothetical protein
VVLESRNITQFFDEMRHDHETWRGATGSSTSVFDALMGRDTDD